MKPRDEWGPADYFALGQVLGPALAIAIVVIALAVIYVTKALFP